MGCGNSKIGRRNRSQCSVSPCQHGTEFQRPVRVLQGGGYPTQAGLPPPQHFQPRFPHSSPLHSSLKLSQNITKQTTRGASSSSSGSSGSSDATPSPHFNNSASPQRILQGSIFAQRAKNRLMMNSDGNNNINNSIHSQSILRRSSPLLSFSPSPRQQRYSSSSSPRIVVPRPLKPTAKLPASAAEESVKFFEVSVSSQASRKPMKEEEEDSDQAASPDPTIPFPLRVDFSQSFFELFGISQHNAVIQVARWRAENTNTGFASQQQKSCAIVDCVSPSQPFIQLCQRCPSCKKCQLHTSLCCSFLTFHERSFANNASRPHFCQMDVAPVLVEDLFHNEAKNSSGCELSLVEEQIHFVLPRNSKLKSIVCAMIAFEQSRNCETALHSGYDLSNVHFSLVPASNIFVRTSDKNEEKEEELLFSVVCNFTNEKTRGASSTRTLATALFPFFDDLTKTCGIRMPQPAPKRDKVQDIVFLCDQLFNCPLQWAAVGVRIGFPAHFFDDQLIALAKELLVRIVANDFQKREKSVNYKAPPLLLLL